MSYFRTTHPTFTIERFPSPLEATLYTYLLETDMMINKQSFGLKGQLILAQGNPDLSGGALG